MTIEHIGKAHIRKEDVVARVLEQHGDRPGLVHIISAMGSCDAYKPWHDKQTHKTSAANACTTISTSWMPGSG